jgi:DNA/RNA endonuclease YhcR with UshA esterase domain
MKKILTACFVLSMALFTLGFLGCSSDSDETDGLFSNIKSGGRGQLTVTGVDSGLYGSYRVYVSSSSSESSYTSNAAASGSASISGSTAAVELYPSGSSFRWSGSGSHYVFFVDSYTGQLALRSSYQVSFTNGSASVSVSSFIVTGRLTITGISSGFYGTYDVYVNYPDSESSYKNNPMASAASVTINSSTSTARVDLHPSGGSSSRWNSSGSYFVFFENRNTGRLAHKSTARIPFTNGSASISANNFAEIIPGRLTVTDISSGSLSNGTYNAYVNSSNDESSYDISPRASGSVTISSSDSTVTVNLFTYGSSSRWSDTGYYYVFIEDNAGQLVAKSNQISFTNGSANVPVSSFTEITPGRLTVTGISSSFYGIYQVYVTSYANNATYVTNAEAYADSVAINSSPVTVNLLRTSGGSSPWDGTGSYYVYLEYDDDSGTQTIMASVYFVRGRATVPLSYFY